MKDLMFQVLCADRKVLVNNNIALYVKNPLRLLNEVICTVKITHWIMKRTTNVIGTDIW